MTITTTTTLGHSPVLTIGKVGHGLMLMTGTTKPVSDEVAFESIKASLDSVPPGCKMVLNSGEFYGINPPEANLELVARFFEKYPHYQDKAFLSVKGGVIPATRQPNSSPDFLKASVDNILAKLRGTKRLDLFECARVDSRYPIEDTIKILAGFVKEGKFDFIGVSECSAATMRRAHAVHPIAANEIEVSPWAYTQEVKDVIVAGEELGIAVMAYSPLGRGFLTGRYTSREGFQNDFRRMMPRLSDENFEHNFKMVEALKAIAEKKGITAAQLCIAWVSSLGRLVVPIPGSSHKSRTEENLMAADIVLTPEEATEVAKIQEEIQVKGTRYPGSDKDMHLML